MSTVTHAGNDARTDEARLHTLVIGGRGKTGRRVARLLEQQGVQLRVGSREGQPSFDWEDPSTWKPALQGVQAVYLTYYPDLAIPGAVEAVDRFTSQAVDLGVERIVLLSGRGEPEAQQAEQVVASSGVEWTVVRASWFAQNFSENYLLEPILAGEVVLPAGDIPEPFIDANDIAEVAVAALTSSGHSGRVHEVTGPRLLTFADAVGEIAAACGRDIQFRQVSSEEYETLLVKHGVPDGFVWLMNYLFSTVLDGRNASVTDGVLQALGREPRDFSEYSRDTAKSGVWGPQAS